MKGGVRGRGREREKEREWANGWGGTRAGRGIPQGAHRPAVSVSAAQRGAPWGFCSTGSLTVTHKIECASLGL